jgi:hypothetical protein
LPSEQMQKITIRIYESDYEFLRELYPNNYNRALRLLVRLHRRKLESKSRSTIDVSDIRAEVSAGRIQS